MAANSHRVGSSDGDATSYRSRDGLSTRPVSASEEIQLRIDPMDLNDEITGLHSQARRLRHVIAHWLKCGSSVFQISKVTNKCSRCGENLKYLDVMAVVDHLLKP
ncbi:hypothetical protein VNO80_06375 [Phaseolus coccineus]|uniref:Uncharacterized protein n=1 Tax=Phaseolus coccineus TaxID=3886 RepID=A0AAN9NLI5_PHACN